MLTTILEVTKNLEAFLTKKEEEEDPSGMELINIWKQQCQLNNALFVQYAKELPAKLKEPRVNNKNFQEYIKILRIIPEEHYKEIFTPFFDLITREKRPDVIFQDTNTKEKLCALKRLIIEWSYFDGGRSENSWVFEAQHYLENLEKFFRDLNRSLLRELSEAHVQIIFLLEALAHHQVKEVTLEKDTKRVNTLDGRIDIFIEAKLDNRKTEEQYYLIELKRVRYNEWSPKDKEEKQFEEISEKRQKEKLLKEAFDQCIDSIKFLDDFDSECKKTKRYAFVCAFDPVSVGLGFIDVSDIFQLRADKDLKEYLKLKKRLKEFTHLKNDEVNDASDKFKPLRRMAKILELEELEAENRKILPRINALREDPELEGYLKLKENERLKEFTRLKNDENAIKVNDASEFRPLRRMAKILDLEELEAENRNLLLRINALREDPQLKEYLKLKERFNELSRLKNDEILELEALEKEYEEFFKSLNR